MFAHLFSWRAKCAHSGGKSAQPPFPPLPVLILGQKFLCKSPQNLCIFKILIWIFPYFTLWHTQLFSERQCIRSPEKSCIHLIRHTEHRDLKTNICCFLSDIQVYVFTFWGRKALFFGVNLFPPLQERSICCMRTLRQVPSELHPATRDNLSSILASKPHRTASPFQCDIPANNNQLVF